MFNRLDAIEEKYNELTKDLSNPEILNDFNKVKELSKEQSDLEETVKTYQKYKQAKNNLEEAKVMENDPELREIALEEIENLIKKLFCYIYFPNPIFGRTNSFNNAFFF